MISRMSTLERLNGPAFKALYEQQLGFSQGMIARELGYTPRQVRNIENTGEDLRPVIVLAMEALLARSRKCEKISANNSCCLKTSA
jgi:predicted transcriptional regulator